MRNTGRIASRHTHSQRRTGQRDLLRLVVGGPLGRRPVIVCSVDEMHKPRIIRIDCKQLRSTGAVLEDEIWTQSSTTLASPPHFRLQTRCYTSPPGATVIVSVSPPEAV